MNITPKHTTQFKFIPFEKRNILALDTEDDSKGKTLIYNFFDGENHYTTRQYDEAAAFLKNYTDKRTEIWCANLNYDIGNLFKFKNSWHLIIKCAGSRFITVKSMIFKNITFKDVFNVMPGQSVKKLGKLIGLEKIEVAGDFDNEYYCQRDTEIVFWALVKFASDLEKKGITLKTTAASTAFTALSNEVPILKNSKLSTKENEYFFEGYYGGRTEVFNTSRIKGPIYAYDIISSYPHAMRSITIPDAKYISNKFDLNYQGMSDVTIKAPDIHIPYLPLKSDKLLFPVGTWRAKYTHFELKKALEYGYKIIKVHSTLCFTSDETQSLKEWVEKIFNERNIYKKEKNEVMSYILKILLNSSYGKFGQGREKTELVPIDLIKTGGGELFNNNQVKVKTIESEFKNFTNFYLASLITAVARDNLYNILKQNPEHALYCDTDSLFTTKKLPNSMLGTGLGDLEFQGEYLEAHFVQPKVYYLKDSENKEYYKCKGVWGDKAMEYFTKGFVNKMQPFKYVETCRKNLYRSRKKEELYEFNIWNDKLKSKRSEYDKRLILKSGQTHPLRVEE